MVAGPDFTIYSGGNFLAKTLDGVWAGQTTIDDAMAQIQAQWQQGPRRRLIRRQTGWGPPIGRPQPVSLDPQTSV